MFSDILTIARPFPSNTDGLSALSFRRHSHPESIYLLFRVLYHLLVFFPMVVERRKRSRVLFAVIWDLMLEVGCLSLTPVLRVERIQSHVSFVFLHTPVWLCSGLITQCFAASVLQTNPSMISTLPANVFLTRLTLEPFLPRCSCNRLVNFWYGLRLLSNSPLMTSKMFMLYVYAATVLFTSMSKQTNSNGCRRAYSNRATRYQSLN